ncbi:MULTISPECIES: ABC transporter ATP-binding protein [Macrococcus]|nr:MULTISPECIES: ABC transporter ATP-binding protein [unclassified Macrococcus]MDJ1111149.1 ABC transporter ATP-binding protein [Macrococcus sp. S115]QYA33331.1 ABC transporter ATP-binding protein [Macrococcus sp. 19Msa1099]QYA38145.1 ABC transporter ATP-binding protein [Macrococcus caseolyticus]QYA76852.1 ABC transporter ATP-binding protein [Macrococcus caseolyticus]
MIKFKHVSKRYGENTVVDDINFEIEEGEFFVIIGPSGSGKTTTLKMINRLVPLSEGYIYFKDRPISDYKLDEMRWDIGYVLQQIALFPHMTIKENISQVPLMKKWSQERIDKDAVRLLNMVGLESEAYLHRYPDELSGGQKQRVGVVRALMADPPVILMDEPFSALDPISREKLQDDLIRLQSEIKKTIIFVTHDLSEALKLGDRICLMNNGKIEQIGTPESFINAPNNEFVKTFMGDAVQIKQYARNIMRPIDVATSAQVAPDTSLHDVYALLTEHEYIAVMEDTRRIGVISRNDVLRQLSKEAM